MYSYSSRARIRLAKRALTSRINTPAMTRAVAIGKAAKICFPRVVYSAKIPKMMERVVAIALP